MCSGDSVLQGKSLFVVILKTKIWMFVRVNEYGGGDYIETRYLLLAQGTETKTPRYPWRRGGAYKPLADWANAF